jgi:hypothetical protein
VETKTNSAAMRPARNDTRICFLREARSANGR